MSDETKPDITLDLDSLERENRPLPFRFLLGGKSYLLSDPQDIDWQDLLAAMSSPQMFFRLVLPADQRETFFAATVASWKMRKLMDRYNDHYGLPNLPNAGGLPR